MLPIPTLSAGTTDVNLVEKRLIENNVTYTRSKSGRAAVFFRDPDSNTFEISQVSEDDWR